jgi:hypothetical protein
LREQTPDPDGGMIYQRRFVPKERINSVVKWGKTGEAMFADAISLYENLIRYNL